MTNEELHELRHRIVRGETIPITQGWLSLITVERERAAKAEAEIATWRELYYKEAERTIRLETALHNALTPKETHE